MNCSVYPDQKPCSVASDRGLHCLLRPVDRGLLKEEYLMIFLNSGVILFISP